MENSKFDQDSDKFVSPERMKRQDYNRIFIIWSVLILLSIGFLVFFPDIARKIEGKNWRVPYMDGEQALQAENWEETETAFAKVIELNPEYSYGYLQLGGVQLKLNMREEAEANFKKCLTLEPRQAHTPAHRNLGNIYYDRKDYKGGIDYWRAASELDGTNDLDYVKQAMGMLYLPGSDPEEAIKALKKAAALKANRSQTHNLLGEFYYNSGAYAEALGSWQNALILSENSAGRPYLHMRMGQCAEKLEDLDSALRYLETAKALDPENAEIKAKYQSLKSSSENSVNPIE
jgi:tetratricopeptide (TPR) repeat protein